MVDVAAVQAAAFQAAALRAYDQSCGSVDAATFTLFADPDAAGRDWAECERAVKAVHAAIVNTTEES